MLTQKGRLLSGVLHHPSVWGMENAASFNRRLPSINSKWPGLQDLFGH
jgi:hypothetical protein